MADLRVGGTGVVCNDSCGCPSPCPGGLSCKCTSSGGNDSSMEHKRCSCGDHCGCNPCTCPKIEVSGSGKAFCKCGPGCTCVTCAS